jgi:hypothetical protein
VIVPNYVPDPLEVPGNVTEQPYLVRIWFIRRVTLVFLGSVLVIAALLQLPLPSVGLLPALAALTGLLITLDLWRISHRGHAREARNSAIALPLVVAAVALCVREVSLLGWPVWQGLAAPVCIAAYTLLSGRDYSFVGNYLLSLIASTVGIAAFALSNALSLQQIVVAFGTNVLLLSYLVYDLASLLSRRRTGEALAAVVDIYRDIFNFFGYFIRVLRHWKRHKIWVVKPTQ